MSQQNECLEGHTGVCKGETIPRESLSGTGTTIARCDYHWDQRLIFEKELLYRYPYNAPADFDPSYAGESWDGE
jgi:hypothetical protein